MTLKKIVYVGVLMGLCAIIICGIIIYNIVHFNDVQISFLDVGQGDSILISKGTQQILIDGGSDGTVLLEQLGKQMPFWDRNIEIIIATHPDSDHIDGLISVFENFSVNQFWHTKAGKNTSTYNALLRSVQEEYQIEDVIAYNGLSANFGEDINLNVIYPFSIDDMNNKDINDTSITAVLSVYDESFYFGGDLSSDIEDILPLKNQITVLKASHHGSNKSTSDNFLQTTKPRDVIFSVGKNNKYGHPHPDVLERVSNIDAQIFRTDINGAIIYVCKNETCDTKTKK